MKNKSAIEWFNVPTSDFNRALKFYETILGEKFKTNEDYGQKMAFFPMDMHGQVGGALFSPDPKSNNQPSKTGTRVYLNCDEKIDEVIARVEKAGGQIAQPKSIVPDPRVIIETALIEDTEGNIIGLSNIKSKSTFTINRDKLEVTQTRIFDAPVEKIWQAFIDSLQIPLWWGPRILTTTVEKMDLKVGGAWRFIQKDPQNKTFAFHGTYQEIIPMEKISDTFNYEGIPEGHEVLETLILEKISGAKTKATSTAKFKNLADLEGMVNTGMESGAVESWDRLSELLQKS